MTLVIGLYISLKTTTNAKLPILQTGSARTENRLPVVSRTLVVVVANLVELKETVPTVGGERGDGAYIIESNPLHCHHQNDFRIKIEQ